MFELPTTRAEAKATGAARYFTGKPCKRGHKSERYASIGACVACHTDREYAGAHEVRWREKNRKGERCSQARYRREKPEVIRTQIAKRRAAKIGSVSNLTASERAAIARLYGEARAMTAISGVSHHVDHLPALSGCGKHHPAFMQVITAEANLRAGARERTRPEWATVALFDGDVPDIPYEEADRIWGEWGPM